MNVAGFGNGQKPPSRGARAPAPPRSAICRRTQSQNTNGDYSSRLNQARTVAEQHGHRLHGRGGFGAEGPSNDQQRGQAGAEAGQPLIGGTQGRRR